MTAPSTRADGRRPRSAKARNRGLWAAAVQQALWGFGGRRRRWDGALREQDWVAATGSRALEDSWTSGKGAEPLPGPRQGASPAQRLSRQRFSAMTRSRHWLWPASSPPP